MISLKRSQILWASFHIVVIALPVFRAKYEPRIESSTNRYGNPVSVLRALGPAHVKYFDNTDDFCEWLYRPWLDHKCGSSNVLACISGKTKGRVHVYSVKAYFPLWTKVCDSDANKECRSVLFMSCLDGRDPADIPVEEKQEDGEWRFDCHPGFLPIVVVYRLPNNELIHQGKCIEAAARQKLKDYVVIGGSYVPGGIKTFDGQAAINADAQRAKAGVKVVRGPIRQQRLNTNEDAQRQIRFDLVPSTS